MTKTSDIIVCVTAFVIFISIAVYMFYLAHYYLSIDDVDVIWILICASGFMSTCIALLFVFAMFDKH